ncbi:MAG: DUF6157 family protein [Beijerinckiaceae bacterium]
MDYRDTLVTIAPDCPVTQATIPLPKAGKPTVALLEYELLSTHPYHYTRDALLFAVHVKKNGLSAADVARDGDAIRATLFAKPRACMRASPLPKSYGWGVHYNEDSKLALVACDSDAYRAFVSADTPDVKIAPAMRNARPK